MNEKNGLDEQSEPQPYGYWDMVGVSNRPYCIKKSYMQRLNVLLSVQVGKCGLLLSKALNMAHWKNPQLNLYQIWNHDLHEALDFIPRFDMDRAVNDTDGYLIELAVMAGDVTSAGNYTGSIDPKLLDFKTTETLGADDADRLWSAIHDELYIQTENLLDMVGRVGYAVEGIRSQIFVRKMFEDAGAVFAKDFVEMYVADLDQLTFVYKKRYDKITNISESFAGYGQFGDDFDELSYLLHDYDGTLHEMECAMFTRWIADERHIELGHDTVRGIGDMDKIVEPLGSRILRAIETLSRRLPISPYVAVDGETYSDVEIDKMFDCAERAYSMLEHLDANRELVLYELGLSKLTACNC